jgi:hypothetical protein
LTLSMVVYGAMRGPTMASWLIMGGMKIREEELHVRNYAAVMNVMATNYGPWPCRSLHQTLALACHQKTTHRGRVVYGELVHWKRFEKKSSRM